MRTLPRSPCPPTAALSPDGRDLVAAVRSRIMEAAALATAAAECVGADGSEKLQALIFCVERATDQALTTIDLLVEAVW